MISFAYNVLCRKDNLMNIKSLIKKILSHSCVYFTVVTAIYSLIVMTIHVDDNEVLLNASRLMLFFVASILFSIANAISRIKIMHGALRLFIHFVLSAFAFYSCMMLPVSPDASSAMVVFAAFTVVYFLAVALIAAFKARYRSRFEDKTEYKSQFQPKK